MSPAALNSMDALAGTVTVPVYNFVCVQPATAFVRSQIMSGSDVNGPR